MARRRERDRRIASRSATCSASPAQTAGHTGDLVEADDDWLAAHDVAHWAGPRSLPLWLPRDMPGFCDPLDRGLPGGRRPPPRRCARPSSAPSPTSATRGLDREAARGSAPAPTSSTCCARRSPETRPICGCRGASIWQRFVAGAIVGPCLRPRGISPRSLRASLPRADVWTVRRLSATPRAPF